MAAEDEVKNKSVFDERTASSLVKDLRLTFNSGKIFFKYQRFFKSSIKIKITRDSKDRKFQFTVTNSQSRALMEFPLFSNNYWNYPHHHSSPSMNPHHWAGVDSSPSMNRQSRTQLPKAASKVVDIPVRFVDSARSEAMKVTAAVKIQKVFRGLLVRKSVKKIDGIRKEVDEIEKRVSEKETILMMMRDGKERLKMNEMLMKLLLRLDSIRGDGDDSLEPVAEVVDQNVEIKGSENVVDEDMKLVSTA